MRKYLDEIMMMSDKGYIDSFDDIEKLTERVMNIDARTLTVKGGCKPDRIIYELIRLNKLPDLASYTVRICDMLNMAHVQAYAGSTGYSDHVCAKYAAITAELLNKAAHTSADIKLFLSISVKAFADFMDEKSGKKDRQCKRMYEEITVMAKESAQLDVDEKTTVKALIDGVRPYMTVWYPRMCTDIFIYHAQQCCEIIEKIFVDFIYTGYKDMFDFNKLRENFTERQREAQLEIEKLFDTDGNKDYKARERTG